MKVITIKELEELDKEATPGPWFREPEIRGKRKDGTEWFIDEHLAYGEQGNGGETFGLDDACEYVENEQLICTLRNNLKSLIERLRDAEELRESVLKSEYVHQYELAVKQEKKWVNK